MPRSAWGKEAVVAVCRLFRTYGYIVDFLAVRQRAIKIPSRSHAGIELRRRASMSSKGKVNPESKPRVRLDIPGTHKRRSIHITGTIHNQFAIPGVWLRGTLHCHLGGHRRAEWVAAAGEHYRRLGYDILAGMDHEMIVPVDPGHDMLAVPGAEV